MAAIFQIRRGTSNISIADGELYIHQGSGSLQFGSGSNNAITLLPLNAPVVGNINITGDITASNLYVRQDLHVSGNLFLGDSTTGDNIQTLGYFNTDLKPATTNTYNIGSPTQNFKTIYASTISASTISNIGGGVNQLAYFSSANVLTSSANSYLINNGVTFGFGTNQYNSQSPERLIVDGGGSYNIATFQTSQNIYAQLNIKNFGTSSNSSTDLVLWNDQSTESSSYVDLGINSSNYNAGQVGYQSDGYLINAANDLYVGSTISSSHGHLHLFGGNLWQSSSISIYNDGTIGFNTDKLNNSASTIPTAGYAVEVSGNVKFDNNVYVSGTISSPTITGLQLTSASLNLTTASLYAFTASILSETASIEARFTTLANVTASYNQVTASLNTFSASINTFTSSTNNRLNNLEIVSTSDISRLTNLENYTSSLVAAMTASGGNLTINGNLNVKGTTTTINSTQVQLSSSVITLDAGGGVNGGIYVNDVVGTAATGSLLWNVNTNYWMAGVSQSESQILTAGGMNIVSGSSQINFTQLSGISSGILSSSTQITTVLPAGVVSGSSQVNFTQLNSISNGIVSSSTQIIPLLPTGTISSSTQVIAGLPTGTISGSTQINNLGFVTSGSLSASFASVTGSFATTGANSFNGNQIITGSLLVSQNITGSISASFAALAINTTTPTQKIHLKGAVGIENGTTAGNLADQIVFGYVGSNLTQYTHKIQTSHDSQAALNKMDFLVANGASAWFDILQLRTDRTITSGSAYVTNGLYVTGSINGAISASNGIVSSSAQVTDLITSLNTFTSSTYTTFSSSVASRLFNVEYTASIPSANYLSINAFTSSQFVSNSFFATTGSNVFQGNQTITGSLYISQNLVVFGSSSIQNITSSTLNIGTNLITVNTFNPSARFGGLAAIDSGSTNLSGSILFDSLNNQWIFQHQAVSGAASTSSVFITGPETLNSLGSETLLTTNRIPKIKNGAHLNDSNISDDGTTISLNSNTTMTGSVQMSGSLTLIGTKTITGSVFISGSKTIIGNNTITGSLNVSGGITGSIAATNGVHSGSYFAGISVVSGSSQINFTQLTGISAGIVSSSTQVTPLLPTGTVSGSSQIDVLSTTNIARIATTGSNTFSGTQTVNAPIYFNNNLYGTNKLALDTTTTTLKIDPNGNFTGGTQFPNAVNMQTTLQVGTTGGNGLTTILFVTGSLGVSGSITATNDITAFATSDIRLKENITPIANALTKVNQISGNTYDWKEGYEEIHTHKGNDVGVIAQEIEKVLPQVVINRDNGYKAVDYEKIVPLLIEAIKELSDKIDRLENK